MFVIAPFSVDPCAFNAKGRVFGLLFFCLKVVYDEKQGESARWRLSSYGLGPGRSTFFFISNMQLFCKICISVSAQYWLNIRRFCYNSERARNRYILLVMCIPKWRNEGPPLIGDAGRITKHPRNI